MKILRRLLAVIALIAVALRGVLSFLSWFERQEEVSAEWIEEEEFEEAI